MTPRGLYAISTCWLLLVLGVLLGPAVCAFYALITAGPFEYSGPRPPVSGESVAFLFAARVLATASALGALAITIVVTAQGGRLISGWVVVVLSLPVVVLLWGVRPG